MGVGGLRVAVGVGELWSVDPAGECPVAFVDHAVVVAAHEYEVAKPSIVAPLDQPTGREYVRPTGWHGCRSTGSGRDVQRRERQPYRQRSSERMNVRITPFAVSAT